MLTSDAFQMSSCVGPDYCGATKTKPRAVRFVCADGRKYKKNVENVRRCGNKKKKDFWG